nr:MAG TPA: hypothetical protein [Caudoviricetes sp.]
MYKNSIITRIILKSNRSNDWEKWFQIRPL